MPDGTGIDRLQDDHSDDRLDAILASVGEHLVIDRHVDARQVEVDGPSAPRRLLLAAAALVIVLAGIVAVGPSRRAVTGWFRAGPFEVELDPDLIVAPALPDFVDGLTPTTADEAAAELGRPLPDVGGSPLGPPDRLWSAPEGGVVVTWDDTETSLWILSSARYPTPIEKWVGVGNTTMQLIAIGDGGFAVEGEHVITTPFRQARAGSVVAWVDGPLVYRLDSGRPIPDLIAAATAIADG